MERLDEIIHRRWNRLNVFDLEIFLLKSQHLFFGVWSAERDLGDGYSSQQAKMIYPWFFQAQTYEKGVGNLLLFWYRSLPHYPAI